VGEPGDGGHVSGSEDDRPQQLPKRGSSEHPQANGGTEAASGEGQQGPANSGEAEQESERLRLYDEDNDFRREAKLRRHNEWRRHISIDWARIVHSPCFRRLQGKTQVFPGHESDFFRNRLTHSLEVAQIAEGIADKINHDNPKLFDGQLIDARLCAAAALMHDLGHAPFGHNGERALDDLMRKFGGFEGNAQSLRIVARLEKKLLGERTVDEIRYHSEIDKRVGLGLTYRALASILKYDNEIVHVRSKGTKLQKGYYASERYIVERIKEAVAPGLPIGSEFKTIECAIMDLADDIAYSTYDLEDCFKAGFLTPARIMSTRPSVLAEVAKKVSEELKIDFEGQDVLDVLDDVFRDIMTPSTLARDDAEDEEEEIRLHRVSQFANYFTASAALVEDGAQRGDFSSRLVSHAICNVTIIPNKKFPALSKVHLDGEARKRVEVLKQYTYRTTIDSPRVKVAEFRGYEVVRDIFKALASPKGKVLMPDDVRRQYDEAGNDISAQRRVICDFVAGMTDRYAIEFYARLHSDTSQSMFKPL
jgi:dGTPase